jgi:AcrR family transcriptional regulator
MRPLEQPDIETDGKTRILRAAYPLFIEQGFKAVSMQQIADAARIHKATLYHHFRHKEDLFSSVVRLALIEMREDLTTIIDRGGLPAEQLVKAAVQIFARTQSDFGRLMTDMHENLAPDLRIDLMKEKSLPWELFQQIVRQAIDEGYLPLVDPEFAISMFVGMVWGQIWMRKMEWTGGPLDRVLAVKIVDVLFTGLGGSMMLAPVSVDTAPMEAETVALKPSQDRHMALAIEEKD